MRIWPWMMYYQIIDHIDYVVYTIYGTIKSIIHSWYYNIIARTTDITLRGKYLTREVSGARQLLLCCTT